MVLKWKSEGFIVPFEDERQQNDIRGKEPYFIYVYQIAKGGDDCIMLETSIFSKETVRALQRKLYLKAKHQSDFRFYSLYDKVYRSDVLQRAYELVKKNKGSPGLDGETFASIEAGIGKVAYLEEVEQLLKTKTYRAMPIKRVNIPKPNGDTRPLGIPCVKDRIVQMAVKLIIEPIFEAGFSSHSYGFRPKRSAHQAMDDIKEGLLQGHIHVIDADLSKYFDLIPHDKLQRTVAERIVDSGVLSLLKQWLKVKVIKIENGRRSIIGGGKKARQGTPQGGVISPLLANIYLNILDRIWERKKLAEKYKARLVRYADDIVILCARDTSQPFAYLQRILNRLDLKLNEEKMQIKDARKEAFSFLGFDVCIAQSNRSGKYFPLVVPSDKSMITIKQKIKHYTQRVMNPVPIEVLVAQLNRTTRGWCNYFHYGHGHLKINKIRYYMEGRLRLHLRYRHKVKNRGASYTRFPRGYLYDALGLYPLPLAAAWKSAHA
jgi:RNA-directed DNA polymerase